VSRGVKRIGAEHQRSWVIANVERALILIWPLCSAGIYGAAGAVDCAATEERLATDYASATGAEPAARARKSGPFCQESCHPC